MDAVVQALLHLVVDLGAKSGQAAESGLDMTARAAETVVEIQMAKGGIEVVAPHQAYDAPAEPDAFRVAGWAIDGLGGFSEFVGLALVFLGGVSGTCCRFAGLIRGRRPALRQRCANADHQGQSGKNEVAQHRKPTLKHSLTHKFPELVLAQVLSDTVPAATLAAK
jgi:hypothetical protein